MKGFLKVDKKYYNSGLKSIDILILSQVEEFTSKNLGCTLTNKQLSSMLGESMSKVKRSLDKLEEMGFIKRIQKKRTSPDGSIRRRNMAVDKSAIDKYLKSLDDASKTESKAKEASEYMAENLGIHVDEEEILDTYELYLESSVDSRKMWSIEDLIDMSDSYNEGMSFYDYVNAISESKFYS